MEDAEGDWDIGLLHHYHQLLISLSTSQLNLTFQTSFYIFTRGEEADADCD